MKQVNLLPEIVSLPRPAASRRTWVGCVIVVVAAATAAGASAWRCHQLSRQADDLEASLTSRAAAAAEPKTAAAPTSVAFNQQPRIDHLLATITHALPQTLQVDRLSIRTMPRGSKNSNGDDASVELQGVAADSSAVVSLLADLGRYEGLHRTHLDDSRRVSRGEFHTAFQVSLGVAGAASTARDGGTP